jgi:hypothetical protein
MTLRVSKAARPSSDVRRMGISAQTVRLRSQPFPFWASSRASEPPAAFNPGAIE